MKTGVWEVGFSVVFSNGKIHEAVFLACLVMAGSASAKLFTSVIQFFMRCLEFDRFFGVK